MFIITKKNIVLTVACLILVGSVNAQMQGSEKLSVAHGVKMQARKTTGTATSVAHEPFDFGARITDADLKQFTSPLPDGRGMPVGSGTVMRGKQIYTEHCLACHGANLEGGLGDRLIGGRGTLASKDGVIPIKTVESYWPYSTTLFDYIKRAMPFTSPNSLSDDDVYAVSAYILSKAEIIPPDATMDQDSLPKVLMPNRNGFIRSNR